jgi:hypothetical protein
MQKIQIAAAALALLLNTGVALAQRGPAANMSFFVTSVGKGDGGNLGGLSGADAQCFKLAASAGAAQHTWRAYLSTNGQGGINARDRIGPGPWFNYKGVRIASNVAELHSDRANINKNTALTEKGQLISGRHDAPNHNDILTGSKPDGTAVPLPPSAAGRGGNRGGGRGARGAAVGGARGDGAAARGPAPAPPDTTCRNWTSNAPDGGALMGHFEREGNDENSGSWNSAHPSSGCSQEKIRTTASDSLLYCFAID